MQAAQSELLSDSQDRVRLKQICSKPQIEIPSEVAKIRCVVMPSGGFDDQRFRDHFADWRSSGEFEQTSSWQFINLRLHLTIPHAMQPESSGVRPKFQTTDARQYRGKSSVGCQKSIHSNKQFCGVQGVVVACGVSSV
jgi:hypothetical protein